jgi:hypothetical protein
MRALVALTLSVLVIWSPTAATAQTRSAIGRISAGDRVQCAWRGSVVPCEVIPLALSTAVKSKAAAYIAEVERHDATISLLHTAERQALECSGELKMVRAELKMARESTAHRLPTWAIWTVVGIVFVAGGVAGFHVGR